MSSLLSLAFAAVWLGSTTPAAEAKERSSARAAPSGAKHPASRAKRAATGSSSKRKARASADPDSGRTVKASLATRPHAPARVSMGQVIGLHSVDDPLDLKSSVALVVDLRSGATLFSKNEQAVLPIASITKLMTALVVLDAKLPLDEVLEITDADIDTEKHTRSRLRIGTRLSRSELLQLALMSSENRAANALGRHYPGGLGAFVQAMNAKARSLGMNDTSFVDPTGLSSRNMSNAIDLARMVAAATDYSLIRDFSTAQGLTVDAGRPVGFRNTNRLTANPNWDIGLQKTGYISEAGKCLVMQISVDGRPMAVVLLDAAGSSGRFGDAQRLRDWLESDARRTPVRTTSAAQASVGS